jgi:UDP-N-acetylglucosamine acyltransferase
MGDIHSTAIISSGAEIGAGTTVGPYSVVGPHVKLGRNNRIASHVVIEGYTTIGDENQIYQFASVGSNPQDLKFKGEASQLIIGNGNIIREYATLQPGTSGGGMKTTIGDKNLFMVNSHIGHDSIVGSGNVFANSVAIAGHVTIGNNVNIGGLVGIHQFVHLGDVAFIAGGSMVTQDIPPYCLAEGNRAGLVGLNSIGLKRRGFSEDQISDIKRAYREIFMGAGVFKDRVLEAIAKYSEASHVLVLLNAIKNSERGISPLRKDLE